MKKLVLMVILGMLIFNINAKTIHFTNPTSSRRVIFFYTDASCTTRRNVFGINQMGTFDLDNIENSVLYYKVENFDGQVVEDCTLIPVNNQITTH